MSKLFVRTFADNQVINAEMLNEVFIDTIIKDYNGGLWDYNLAAGISVSANCIADATISSRKLKLTQALIKPTANLTLTTSYADIPGATVTFTPAVASTIVVMATFDFAGVINTSGIVSGVLDIDGATQTGVAQMDNDSAGARILNCSQCWTADLTAAAHTVKLQAKKAGAGGTVACNANSTTFSYFLIAI